MNSGVNGSSSGRTGVFTLMAGILIAAAAAELRAPAQRHPRRHRGRKLHRDDMSGSFSGNCGRQLVELFAGGIGYVLTETLRYFAAHHLQCDQEQPGVGQWYLSNFAVSSGAPTISPERWRFHQRLVG